MEFSEKHLDSFDLTEEEKFRLMIAIIRGTIRAISYSDTKIRTVYKELKEMDNKRKEEIKNEIRNSGKEERIESFKKTKWRKYNEKNRRIKKKKKCLKKT